MQRLKNVLSGLNKQRITKVAQQVKLTREPGDLSLIHTVEGKDDSHELSSYLHRALWHGDPWHPFKQTNRKPWRRKGGLTPINPTQEAEEEPKIQNQS